MGYASDGFAGAVPFEWREIQAFCELTQNDLLPVEASCLMDMSRAYAAEVAQRSPLRKAPMERDI